MRQEAKRKRTPRKKARIESIDLLRGVIMIIMALDHARYYFHYDSFFFSATDISQTNPALFFTRFITHFCAPAFLFLSGCSAFLAGKSKTKKEIWERLTKRGAWLILIAFTLEEFAWYFRIDFTSYELGVLWSLGASMLILAFVQFLPKIIPIIIAFAAIFLQHLTDGFRPEATDAFSIIWRILHVPGGFDIGGIHIGVAFPLLPWAATMILGFYFGRFFVDFAKKERKKWLTGIGFGSVLLFFVLRLINIYGDQHPWIVQDTYIKSILSFFNISKSPASLDFILLTVGGSVLFLAFAEGIKNKFTDFCVIIGRTPFMFYLLHIYLIHLGAMILGYFQGYDLSSLNGWISSQKHLQGYGVSLGMVYLITMMLVFLAYPLCKRFYRYKTENRNFISGYF